ncbi:protein FAM234A [Protopterus annectens]|uniref:protein FAM234A n=1 Tax=Protopterus annectens TaxID=7888 RepID=UPI001CFBA507|nr:protein FAM234A [Protopterus annectens]
MEGKNEDPEICPLKNEEEKGPENSQCISGQKDIGHRIQSKISHLSSWRTAAFFITLFLCLVVVFAFSFILPCPVRAVSVRTWTRTFHNAGTYSFLTASDINKDKVVDLLFALKGSNSSLNVSCSDEGLPSPCGFLIALSGTNGSTLWERPVGKDILLIKCKLQMHDKTSGCVVLEKPNIITAFDLDTGHLLWNHTINLGSNATVLNPIVQLPDMNGDGVDDILLAFTEGSTINGAALSGRDGNQIGQVVIHNVPTVTGFLLHKTNTGSHYLLVNTGKLVYGFALKDVYRPETASLKQDSEWLKKKTASNSTSDYVLVYSSSDVRNVLTVPGQSPQNILALSSSWTELLNGQNLRSLWKTNTSHVFNKPTFGMFKKDQVSVVIEDEYAAQSKKVLIIDSNSGNIMWEQDVISKPGSPQPATISTVDHHSVFLFWGEIQSQSNVTVPYDEKHYLFAMHPKNFRFLLQLNNGTSNIMAFDALLFERGRHACYVLLTGPSAEEELGTVSISKRKLKEDVVYSNVIRLSDDASSSDEDVKQLFLNLRFSSETLSKN